MTQTSKATAKITFRTIKGTSIRRNVETGVEIHNDGADGYTVWTPARTGRDHTMNRPTLAEARALAILEVEWMRVLMTEAYDEAIELISADVREGLADLAGHIGSKPVRTLLSGARASLDRGFVVVAYSRLARARAIIADPSLVPTNLEAAEALAATIDRMPVGSLVRVGGDRLARVEPGPNGDGAFIEAETNRVLVPVSYCTIKIGDKYVKQGYGTVYAEIVEAV
jgi:hypothetical protein